MKMANYRIVIKEIADRDGIITSTQIIRDSFQTVATEFGLTQQNCPTHPSFITVEQLLGLKEKGLTFFGFFLDDHQVGFVATEKADGRLYYIEKLAVLPVYRHGGFGSMLIEHAIKYVRANGGTRISIGIIDEHLILKNWYQGLGFKAVDTKKFPHLPFTVAFMEMDI